MARLFMLLCGLLVLPASAAEGTDVAWVKTEPGTIQTFGLRGAVAFSSVDGQVLAAAGGKAPERLALPPGPHVLEAACSWYAGLRPSALAHRLHTFRLNLEAGRTYYFATTFEPGTTDCHVRYRRVPQ